ncbi:MAG: SDR family oxidoreductase [Alphaproteobacteria bacterium]|nr:SDR family oxidoreductase [Alphaproteobacteria bacterium]
MPTVLVTGSRQGLGLEFVRQFAAAGWRVYATGVDLGDATELQTIARGAPERVTLHPLDVTDHPAVERFARSLNGVAIDVLLNNAGVKGPEEQLFGAIDYALWDQILRINVMGPMKMTECFVEHVARSQRKMVVMLASGLASMQYNVPGTPGPVKGGLIYYRTSKSALNMLVRNLALDLKPRGITVVGLVPGHVRTAQGGPDAPLSPEESIAGMRRQIDMLGLADSGRYILYTGKDYPW